MALVQLPRFYLDDNHGKLCSEVHILSYLSRGMHASTMYDHDIRVINTILFEKVMNRLFASIF